MSLESAEYLSEKFLLLSTNKTHTYWVSLESSERQLYVIFSLFLRKSLTFKDIIQYISINDIFEKAGKT